MPIITKYNQNRLLQAGHLLTRMMVEGYEFTDRNDRMVGLGARSRYVVGG